jgi:protein-tyrosine phosphatase
MRALLAEHGLGDRLRVDSAGTTAYHAGDSPDERMRAAAERRGYRLEGSARPLELEDFDRFDLIVAMDRANLRDIRALSRDVDGQVRLLSHFLAPGSPVDVPDPYYGGGRGFETVLDMIEGACPAILEHLLEQTPRAGRP